MERVDVTEYTDAVCSTAWGAEPLLRTLEAYFAAGGNASLTARSLHLSVRALTYRLEKIAAKESDAIVGLRFLDVEPGNRQRFRR